ncbi:MAG: Tellurite resistance protein TerB [Leptolyngbya sp. LCM1.Bin17]|nr:MAG: Tellurite resistance protein TerB [Leptolyngbya sp. LCM1.Bin17]
MAPLNLVYSYHAMNHATMTPAAAFASIALVAIAADGYLSDQEGEDMAMLLSRMELFSELSGDGLHRLLDQLLDQLKRHGPGELVAQAKVYLPADLRETAFAIATDLVLSDRTVTLQEQAFLDDLYRILDIPEAIARQIVQVLTIKNRG